MGESRVASVLIGKTQIKNYKQYLMENEPKEYKKMLKQGNVDEQIKYLLQSNEVYRQDTVEALLKNDPMPENATDLERAQHMMYLEMQAREFAAASLNGRD